VTSPQADEAPLDIGEATEWVRAAVADAGPLELVHQEPWASVYRAPVKDTAVWFKACAPHQAFEVRLTAALSSRWPSTVTDVLAHDEERRWLLMADAGIPLDAIGNPPERWLELLPAYAELQIGETNHVDEHLANGVPDRRLETLPALADQLLASELPLEPSERAALRTVLAEFEGPCEELQSLGIGPSIQHDDLHMTNVYLKEASLRILDWGDSAISHPFFSLFVTFRFLAEKNGLSADDPWFARLRDAYLEPWGGDRREAFDLALRLSGLAHVIAWLAQRAALPPSERPEFDRWFAVILRLALARASERR
jgi:Phosphotransferase enzyme family